MPMDRETHEAILNELLNPEIEQSKRTELLQELRVDYGSVITDHSELTQTNEKLLADNSDLVISNSKLFRQIGITDQKDNEEVKEKEFSETVTLEGLGV